MNNTNLYNESFLTSLFEQQERDLYAKIIALDRNDNPIDQIEGLVTGGSVNLDGDSSVRRTCSLQLVPQDTKIKSYYWGLKTKFKLELGLTNQATKDYDQQIIWFKMGTYVVASFNTSLSATGFTVSISGKDKMCLLNGDLGGQLFASIDFGTEETITTKFTKVDVNGQDSEALMAKQYYIIAVDTIGNMEIAKSDSHYVFQEIEDDNFEPYWCLVENKYKYRIQNPGLRQRYAGYKIVTQPSELFYAWDGAYEASKYYYLVNGIYKISNATEKDNNIQYYKLHDLYEKAEEYSIKKIPLEKIIRESVHAQGLEPYHNIIINDVDKYGLEQLQWRGEDPLVMILDNNNWINAQLYEYFKVYGNNDEEDSTFEFANLNSLISNIDNNGTKFGINNGKWSTQLPDNNKPYRAVKINFGQDVGYRVTDLVYNGDLITSIGETLTSMLDKIKAMLGEFEYFYDIDGRFIFQRKRIYVNTSWSHIINSADEQYVNYGASSNKITFSFEDNKLLTAIQSTPNLANVRNDISVWGKREGISGAEIAIHARYAIDIKPQYYHAFNGDILYTEEYNEPVQEQLAKCVDWREIIYRMALDYFAGQGSLEKPVHLDDFNTDLDTPDKFLYYVGLLNGDFYPSGYTGYEQYYTDIEGFWRQLYNPYYEPVAIYTQGTYKDSYSPIGDTGFYTKEKVWQNGSVDYRCDYYIKRTSDNDINTNPHVSPYIVNDDDERLYWNKAVFESPETLNFWLEFLDSGDLVNFNVKEIGIRSKVVNADKASAIVFQDIPEFIFYTNNTNETVDDTDETVDDTDETTNDTDETTNDTDDDWISFNGEVRKSLTGYQWLSMPDHLTSLFSISYRNLSVKNKIDELLFQHGYCSESISLTALPIFNLEPNTRIYVHNEDTGIDGDYIINRIGFSLNYNGTMSINAVKAPERLY